MAIPEDIVIKLSSSRYLYNYYLKDYLGNVKEVLRYGSSSPISSTVQITDYDPFGIAFNYRNLDVSVYLYNGKEVYTDFSSAYDGVYDFGARLYNPLYGRWFAPDPAKQGINPYTYCGNNPVMLVDPDGRWVGKFYTELGKYLGWDGINDDKIYILKTKQSTFNDSGTQKVDGAGMSSEQQAETEKFIEENDGNTAAFESNSIAYDNSIEIESDPNVRQQMEKVVRADNSRGGRSDSNNREYGGRINPKTGKIEVAIPGPVVDLTSDERATIKIQGGAPSFHSHASGTRTVGMKYYFHVQHPSKEDLATAGNYVHYVFGREDGKVYIYNSEAIQAVIPIKVFKNL